MGLGYAVFAIAAAVAIGFGGVLHQMRLAAEIERRHRARGRKLAAHVRGVARECLALKRNKRMELARRDAVREEVATLRQRLHAVRQSAAALVVFDERKAMGDRLWSVPVQRVVSGGQVLPWRGYLVWAPTPERAVAKLRARYPNPDRHRIGEAAEKPHLPQSA